MFNDDFLALLILLTPSVNRSLFADASVFPRLPLLLLGSCLASMIGRVYIGLNNIIFT